MGWGGEGDCSEIGGLVESGDSIIKERGFKFFIICSSEKHLFITTGIHFFSFFVYCCNQ